MYLLLDICHGIHVKFNIFHITSCETSTSIIPCICKGDTVNGFCTSLNISRFSSTKTCMFKLIRDSKISCSCNCVNPGYGDTSGDSHNKVIYKIDEVNVLSELDLRLSYST